jgi:LacI family transcriptional regulator
VLNGRGDGMVDPHKQARIRQVAQIMGYVPNAAAVSLQARRTATIGLITDKIASAPFAGPLITGANESAIRRGYALLTIDTQAHEDYMAGAVSALLARDVEGLVYAAQSVGEVSIPEAAYSRPLVLSNAFSRGDRVPSFIPDDLAGEYAATIALLDLGHTDIVFIAGRRSDHATKQRVIGFEAAMRDRGIPTGRSSVVSSDYNMASGYASAWDLLSRPGAPTAILCANDRAAVGALLAAARLGIRVPDDLSVIGYDDEQMVADNTAPLLTTVSLPHEEMGARAVTTLLDLIEARAVADERTEPVRVECRLVRRASIAPPPP